MMYVSHLIQYQILHMFTTVQDMDPNFITEPLTYSAGGLMMTCSQVETCSLYNPINKLLC